MNRSSPQVIPPWLKLKSALLHTPEWHTIPPTVQYSGVIQKAATSIYDMVLSHQQELQVINGEVNVLSEVISKSSLNLLDIERILNLRCRGQNYLENWYTYVLT